LSRLIHRPLEVMEFKGHPAKVRWQGRWVQVITILDRWYDAGKWWEGEPPWLFFRILLEGNRIWEIFFDQDRTCWNLYKIYD